MSNSKIALWSWGHMHLSGLMGEGGGVRVGNSASYLKKTQIKHIYTKLIDGFEKKKKITFFYF